MAAKPDHCGVFTRIEQAAAKILFAPQLLALLSAGHSAHGSQHCRRVENRECLTRGQIAEVSTVQGASSAQKRVTVRNSDRDRRFPAGNTRTGYAASVIELFRHAPAFQ